MPQPAAVNDRRKRWDWTPLEQFWQDTRFAVRTLRRTPVFTAVAVISLALGIGANTAIFSVINVLMLRLLPVRNPEQLVELLQKYPGEPRGNGFWTLQSYQYYRDHNHVFGGLTGFGISKFFVRSAAIEPETIDGQYVVGNFFPLLGVESALGRLIGPEDDRIGAGDPAVAVLDWDYWNSRFNLDTSILGRKVYLEDVPVTIVGVTPREFSGLALWSRPSVWVPAAMEPMISHTKPDRILLALVGRLRPGISLDRAQAEMSVLYRFTIEERARTSKDPVVRQLRVEVAPADAGLSRLRDQLAQPLLLQMSVVGLLLLIACTNIASLLLARAAARQNEMAVRVGLGAGRFRLVRQVFTESLLLSMMGALIGTWLAYFGAEALVRTMVAGLRDPGMPANLEIAVIPDGHVLLFTMGIALSTGLLFGLAPAVRASATSPILSLHHGGRSAGTRRRSLFAKGLVITQVAFSMVLLSAAGLFVGHLSNLEHIDLGFRRDHLLVVTLDPAHSGLKSEQLSRSYLDLLSRLNSIPGVRAATLCAPVPISGAGASRFANVEGHPERPEDRRYLSVAFAAPKYFETLGTPLIAGRDFSFEDQGRQPVAIINQAMSGYYFHRRSPIGQHIKFDGDSKSYEIVGVVGNAKYYEIREPSVRTVYLDAFQNQPIPSHLVLRTAMAPSTIAAGVRRAVHDLLAGVPVTRITTMAEQVDTSIAPERLIAAMSGLFGGLGTVLAAIGLYGLIAYTVARRTHEIGIRMALGATGGDVLRMVLEDALFMVCGGLVIGIPLALWGKGLVSSLVPDLPLTSVAPVVFGVITMIGIGLFAAFWPARRASVVDPIVALHHE